MKAHIFRRAAAALSAALLAAVLLCAGVSAAGSIDTAREGSITIYFGHEGEHFSGAAFELHRIASLSADGEFTLTEEFESMPISVDVDTTSELTDLANTLEMYIAWYGVDPLRSGVTGSSGRVTFGNLEPGLYLVTHPGEYLCGHCGRYYDSAPMLLSLPRTDEDGGLDYDFVSHAKLMFTGFTEDEMDVTVIKKWNDSGNYRRRPASVRVALFDGDGNRVGGEVLLSADNNWRHTWHDLPADSYRIVELDVPDGYTYLCRDEESGDAQIFTITNTYRRPHRDPTPTPEPAPDPTPRPTVDPTPPPEKLPQTGMLWLPVVILGGAGAVLVIAGAVLKGRKRGDDEK